MNDQEMNVKLATRVVAAVVVLFMSIAMVNMVSDYFKAQTSQKDAERAMFEAMARAPSTAPTASAPTAAPTAVDGGKP